MPKERLTMRQIKEVLRLKHGLGLSQRAISESMGIPRTTLRDYLLRAKVADLRWPLPEDISNEELNVLLFPIRSEGLSKPCSEPDWDQTHHELKRKGVTLQLLWEEYKREHLNGYQYSWYAHRYRQWSKAKEVWMVQSHDAGDKVFVDYSGLTFPIWKTNLKEIDFYAEIFVSVLGASDLIFCLVTQSQTLEDWIHAHNKMFAYYGGVSSLIVPDNLRSGVTKAHRYEALCNRTYDEMAEHYACAIMPARSYKPKDKAKVEKSVQSVQRRILAPLRDKQFTSLTQCHEAMAPLLEALNEKPFQKLSYSRRTLFDKVEKNALQSLPTTPYDLARWHQETVNGGYHIQANQHYYSVPYAYVRKKIDIRVSRSSVECFYQEKRISCHVRDDTPHHYTTVDAHRPESHRQQAMWGSRRLLSWAQSIGQRTGCFIQQLLQDKKRHLHQKERSALGILRLSHAFDEARLEKACQQAMEIGTFRYDSVESLLKNRRHHSSSDRMKESLYQSQSHENVRGSKYYH